VPNNRPQHRFNHALEMTCSLGPTCLIERAGAEHPIQAIDLDILRRTTGFFDQRLSRRKPYDRQVILALRIQIARCALTTA
jgi:hypothetical protein